MVHTYIYIYMSISKILCNADRILTNYSLLENLGAFILEPVSDMIMADIRLQTTQPTSGGAVTADKNCCANCVEPSRPQQWGPDLPFFGHAGHATRWMAGAAAHKSG